MKDEENLLSSLLLNSSSPLQGGLLVIDKPKFKTSFSLVSALRRLTKIKTIGHAGTLDPFATGVMVMLVGKHYTRQSEQFMNQDKEYLATVFLGVETDTYDTEGSVVLTDPYVPSLSEVEEALCHFQGKIFQIPPMFSAKKVEGKKLYELARKGIEIERAPVQIELKTTLLSYNYPEIKLKIECSKGTYIRTLAYDLGKKLKTVAHLSALVRTRSGQFHLKDCLNGELLFR